MHLFGHRLDHDYYFELLREEERAAHSITRETDFGNEVFCIDPKTETLLIHETRSRVSRSSHFTYVYRNYDKIGDHLSLRSVQSLIVVEAYVYRNADDNNPETLE